MEFTTFKNQVAGTSFISTSSLLGSFPLIQRAPNEVCKPATAQELGFYLFLKENSCVSKVKTFRKFTPRFIGQISINPDKQLKPSPVSRGTRVGKLLSKSSRLSSCSSLPIEQLSHTQDQAQSSIESLEDAKKRKKSGSVEDHLEGRIWSYSKLWETFSSERNTKVLHEKEAKTGEDEIVYIVLENITHSLSKPHIMDLKMGTQQHGTLESAKKKRSKTTRCSMTTSNALGFRLAGMHCFTPRPCNTQPESVFRDKYWGRGLDVDSAKQAFRDFFRGGMFAHQVRKLLLDVEQLIGAVKSLPWRFYGCSALIVFDAADCEDNDVTIKVIDFAKTEVKGHVGYDKGFVFGLESITEILRELAGLPER